MAGRSVRARIFNRFNIASVMRSVSGYPFSLLVSWMRLVVLPGEGMYNVWLVDQSD